MATLLLLVACAPDAARDVHVVQSSPSSDGWTSYDTGTTVDTASAFVPALECAPPGDEPAPGETIPVDWCTRVTPEVALQDTGAVGVDTEPTAGDSGGSGPEGGGPPAPPYAPPPCGFTNLVGSVGLAGTPDSPALLYCDADPDGGMRFVRVDPATGGVRSNLLVSLDCDPEPSTGTLMPNDDGSFLALWSGLGGPGEDGGTYGLITAQISADGELVSGPDYVPAGDGAWKVSLAEGANPLALVADMGESLWAIPLGERAAAPEDPVPVGETVRGMSAFQLADGVLAAACHDDGTVEVMRLDAHGALVSQATLDGATCGWSTHPSFVSTGDRLAMAWDDGQQGFLAWLDPDGTVLSQTSLGFDALQPQLTWTGSDLLLLTSDGALTRMDPDGDVLGTWWHPGFVDPPGSPQTDRLLYADGRAVFVFMGVDSYPIGGGHINTFNYLEVSGAAVPTP